MFDLQSEFIDLDVRKNRPTKAKDDKGYNIYSYPLTVEFMNRRHSVMLPPEVIQGKTILDVGSCMGATGAWCLYHGAKHYTGVEVQPTYIKLSNQLLSKYYKSEQFEIVNQPAEHMRFNKRFDIVVASGILYGVFDPFSLVKSITSLARERVIIESRHPYLGYRTLWQKMTGDDFFRDRGLTASIIQVTENNKMSSADSDYMYVVSSTVVSVRALTFIFNHNGWDADLSLYHKAEKEIPEIYDITKHDRFMIQYFPTQHNPLKYLYQQVHNSEAEKTTWTGPSTQM